MRSEIVKMVVDAITAAQSETRDDDLYEEIKSKTKTMLKQCSTLTYEELQGFLYSSIKASIILGYVREDDNQKRLIGMLLKSIGEYSEELVDMIHVEFVKKTATKAKLTSEKAIEDAWKEMR